MLRLFLVGVENFTGLPQEMPERLQSFGFLLGSEDVRHVFAQRLDAIDARLEEFSTMRQLLCVSIYMLLHEIGPGYI